MTENFSAGPVGEGPTISVWVWGKASSQKIFEIFNFAMLRDPVSPIELRLLKILKAIGLNAIGKVDVVDSGYAFVHYYLYSRICRRYLDVVRYNCKIWPKLGKSIRDSSYNKAKLDKCRIMDSFWSSHGNSISRTCQRVPAAQEL